jgi:hypothetical protein
MHGIMEREGAGRVQFALAYLSYILVSQLHQIVYIAVDADYTAFSQTLSFTPGAGVNDRACFNFTAIDDMLVESTEDITIEAFSSNSDVQFTQGGSEAVIEIINDDGEIRS